LGTTLHSNTRESLAPEDLVLGQIVPFEAYITVNGSTQPENGKISMEMFWSTKTTSGSDFGYDGKYMVYAAFVDITHSTDPLENARVTKIDNKPNTADFTSVITVEGLDNGDIISVEIWVVLQETLPNKIAGNNDSSFVRADTASGEVITKSAQTVPLLKPSDFLAYGSLQINKSFADIPMGYVLPAYVDVDVISDYYPTFTLNIPIDSTGNGTIIKAGLVPGTYTISEVTIPEFSSSYPGGMSAIVPPKGLATLSIVNTFNVPPAIRVTKTASPTHVPETGGNVTFTFLVENIGPQTVILNSLVDDVFGDLNGKGDIVIPQTILSGGFYSGSFTIWLSSDTLTAHTNVVTATATDDYGKETKDDDSETVTFDDVLPDITVTKVAVLDTLPEPGGDFTFTIQVTNNGVESVTLMSLVDSVYGAITIPVEKQTIAAGGMVEFQITIPHTEAGIYENTVTAVAKDNEGNEDTAEATETVTVTDALPDIAVTKVADPKTMLEPGGDFVFTIQVTNNGVESVTLMSLVDSVYGAITIPVEKQTIAAGGMVEFQITIPHTEAGIYENTVTAVAKDNEGNEDTEQATETVYVTDVLPVIAVVKTADKESVPETGGVVNFTFEVTNNSVEKVMITEVNDSDFGVIYKWEYPMPEIWLDPGGSITFHHNGAIISGDFESGTQHENTVTASAVDNEGNPASDTDTLTISFTDVTAVIDVEKEVRVSYGGESWSDWADADDPTGPIVVEGYSVEFRFTVINSSPVTLYNISLTDSVYDVTGITIPASLAPGASFEGTISTLAVIGQHTNTATASGSFTDGAGNVEIDTDTDDANYYGIGKGQPSIQIEYLMISASSESDIASGSFRITDQSTAAKVPDGALIVLKDFGLDWTTKAKKAKVFTDIEATGCTFWVVSKEKVDLDVPEQIIPGVPYIFDEEIIIEYECTFADKVLVKGASLKGTAWATIYGRPDMRFTYSSTVIVQ